MTYDSNREIENLIKCILILLFSSMQLHANSSYISPIPIVSIKPIYPMAALDAGIQGWVEFEFKITTAGRVKDLEVIGAEPKGVFEESAKAAFKKFLFKPALQDNKAIEILARQKIEFTLPNSNQFKSFPLDKLKELRKIINAKPLNNSWVVLSETVNIKSKIKPKNVKYQHYFFRDDDLNLLLEPTYWNSQKPIDDINSITFQKMQSITQNQYHEYGGLFKRFQKIYSAKKYPPLLLTSVDEFDFTSSVNIKRLKFKIDLSESGKILKINGSDRESKQFLMFDFNNNFANSLKFSPAIKDHKYVKSSITVKFTVVQVNHINLLAHQVANGSYKYLPHPWVRLAVLADKNGDVIDAQVLNSSNKQFEAAALNAIKLQKFNTNDEIEQFIFVIEFEKRK